MRFPCRPPTPASVLARLELCFLCVVALATTMTVPVVGTLLIFSLMIGPPAAARFFTARPQRAIALSVVLALVTVWTAIAASYSSDYPVGFFVGTISACSYLLARAWAGWRRRRRATQHAAGGAIGARGAA
jgi:zinc/manganese transport system permease protein